MKQVTSRLEDLPLPRLEIEWKKMPRGKWNSYYTLVLPQTESEIRTTSSDNTVRIKMAGGHTEIDKHPEDHYLFDWIRVPRTITCLIDDMNSLRLRAFIKVGNKVNEVIDAIHPNFENELKEKGI